MSTSTIQSLPLQPKGAVAYHAILSKFQVLGSQHYVLTALTIACFTTLVATIDYATGDEVPLMVLYLPAIIACCWLTNIGVGVALSLICSCLWLVDDVLLIEQSTAIAHKYWLAMVHLAFFGVVAAMTWRLRLAQERERALARTDALTGLANRKAFLEAIDREIARCQRNSKPLSIAYLDCDNFKDVNDTQGHAAGDEVLVSVSSTSKINVRPSDVVARLGGDEFAVLLPDANGTQAEEIVSRLQQRLTAEMRKNGWPVTFSIGVAAFSSAPQTADELIGAADQLMYDIKSTVKSSLKLQCISPV